jgi:transcriptional regulator GlxA family with amidase domain
MDIAFVLFPRFTALDVIGPYNVLAYGPDVTTHFVAAASAPVAADAGTLRIEPDVTFDDFASADVVVVPGGPGWRHVAETGGLVEWLRAVDRSARYMTSVCTGAFALGNAGLLRDRKATTHWATVDHLAEFGAIHVPERVVVDGRYVTAAGVSAGIDMALTLAGLLWGDTVAETIQLANEYDPHPPYSAGSPSCAPPDLVELLRDQLDSGRGAPARG